MGIRKEIGALIGVILLLLTAFVYQRLENNASAQEILVLIVIVLLSYMVCLAIFTWFYARPWELFDRQKDSFETLHKKIKATVDKLIQRQRFIDQSILSIIEGEAQNIWVITTKLANELRDEDLQSAVKRNLQAHKHYIYFIPHPDAVHFSSVKKNLTLFKRLPLYQEHKGQIEFITLPLETQFLLEEVVIYNPEQDENPSDETKGINGFTYYEAKDKESDTLHMKIEGDLLKFLAERLFAYVQAEGLRIAAERVLTDYTDFLVDDEKLYLVGLLQARQIPDRRAYNAFLTGMRSRENAAEECDTIETILNQYLPVT